MSEVSTLLFPGNKIIFEDSAFPHELAIERVGFLCVDSAAYADQCHPGANVEERLPKHNRSFVFWRHDTQGNSPVTDEFGVDRYIATKKGGVIDQPEVRRVPYERDGFQINCLQNGRDAFDSIVKSKHLRTLGIPMEWVFAASYPGMLPDPRPADDVHVPLLTIPDFIKAVPADATEMNYSLLVEQLLEGVAASDYRPLETYRLHKSEFRLWDLVVQPPRGIGKDVFIDLLIRDLAPTFVEKGYIESASDIRHHERAPLLTDYFKYCFAEELGKAVWELHRKGFRHHFLHGGNVNLAAELVDSDSVTGPFPWTPDVKGTPKESLKDFARIGIDLIAGMAGFANIVEMSDEKFGYFAADCLYEFVDSYAGRDTTLRNGLMKLVMTLHESHNS